jgi:hypothetical protein
MSATEQSPDLASAQSALTAAGEQYATSNDAPYEDRQDLVEHIRALRAAVEQLKDGAE